MAINRKQNHYFLDEAGNPTFFGKKRIPLRIGQEGVSNTFMVGMVYLNGYLDPLREKITALEMEVQNNTHYNSICSVQKRIEKGGFYFHANADTPELRKIFFDFLLEMDCRCEIVVGRKDLKRFVRKHNSQEPEFYADLLSHLIQGELHINSNLVFNMAQLGNSTSQNNLLKGLEKAEQRFITNNPDKNANAKVRFHVWDYQDEPLLAVIDYLLWTVQRVFEKGETEYYDYLNEKIVKIIDLYDPNGAQIYTIENPLTHKNKISPQP